MSAIELVSSVKSFEGEQRIYKHASAVLGCEMHFSIYLPAASLAGQDCPLMYWLSGLTCTEKNFIEKSGFQRYASEHGLIVVGPDTSPRGEGVADDEGYDLGQGAGFYVNATEGEWAKHFKMYDYVVKELPGVINGNFGVNGHVGICGHSMGGHGALTIALKNPGMFKSVSAMSPIVAPTQVPWGEKALGAYLGDDREAWEAHDAVCLVKGAEERLHLLIDQGTADDFLEEQLRPELLTAACEAAGHSYELRLREGYDHGYYYVASFIGEHIAYHAGVLGGG